MTAEIRWGILGTGRICHDFVKALRHVQRPARMVAVGSRSLIKAKEFAAAHGADTARNLVRCYGSYYEVCEDEDIDIVYIGLPNSEHASHTLLALRHRKPVLCEKTFALSASSAEQVLVMAAQQKLLLMEANWMPFWPLVAKALELLRTDVIGEPHLVVAGLGFANNHQGNPGLLDSNLGGGALLACGIYTVSFAHMVFGGAPTSISAQGTLSNTGVDLTTAALLQYGTGKQAVLTTSIDNNIPSNATVFGSKGQLTLHGIFVCPLKLTVNIDGIEQVFEDTPPGDEFDSYNFPNSAGLSYEADHMAKCMHDGLRESPLVPHSHTMDCARTLDEIKRQIGLKISPKDDQVCHGKRKCVPTENAS